MDSAWSYYLPDDGHTAEDAIPIPRPEWQDPDIWDAEQAAEYAAEDEWSNHDGQESGVNSSYTLAVISPSKEETRFTVTHEVEVVHSVRKLGA